MSSVLSGVVGGVLGAVLAFVAARQRLKHDRRELEYRHNREMIDAARPVAVELLDTFTRLGRVATPEWDYIEELDPLDFDEHWPGLVDAESFRLRRLALEIPNQQVRTELALVLDCLAVSTVLRTYYNYGRNDSRTFAADLAAAGADIVAAWLRGESDPTAGSRFLLRGVREALETWREELAVQRGK